MMTLLVGGVTESTSTWPHRRPGRNLHREGFSMGLRWAL